MPELHGGGVFINGVDAHIMKKFIKSMLKCKIIATKSVCTAGRSMFVHKFCGKRIIFVACVRNGS
jgi:hypothetical protein